MLLRRGAPPQAGMSPSLPCFLGLGRGPTCPSETKPSGHPAVPKGTLLGPTIPSHLIALASVAPSVKWGCRSSLAELDAAREVLRGFHCRLSCPRDPVPEATVLLGRRAGSLRGCTSSREDFPLEHQVPCEGSVCPCEQGQPPVPAIIWKTHLIQ